MINLEQFYEAVLVSYQAYCKVNENKPTIFVCSPQLRVELGQTVLGLQIEVDDTLFGYQDAWYFI